MIDRHMNPTSMKRLLVVAVAMLALLAGACSSTSSDTADSADPADATDTSGTGSTDTSSQPDPSATTTDGGEVTIETSDGESLAASVFNPGQPTAVVLGHMRGTGKETWFDFAETLAAEGNTAVAIDFRGYGGSTGERDTDLDTDLLAAVAWAQENGAERVFVFGASMGGTATVAVGAAADLAGIASLSGPASFASIDALAAAPDVDEPFLAIAAEDDQPYAGAATQFGDLAPDAEVVIYAGSSHGTNLFDDNGDDLTQLLLEFVS